MIRRPPVLYVEGSDDVSVISNLLARHGIDTERGNRFLNIKHVGNDDGVFEVMSEAIRNATEEPVGFVIDIDIDVGSRWNRVCAKVREAGLEPPRECPRGGYIARLPGYPHFFGIWMMADCCTDGSKLECLVHTLVPAENPLWPFAQQATKRAAEIIEEANRDATENRRFHCYRPVDRVKAEAHTWLAWQRSPGVPLGAAIQDRILEANSRDALVFLKWLGDLYQFDSLVASILPMLRE